MRTQFVACVGLSMVLGACAQREVPPPASSTLTRASAKQRPSVFDVPPQEMRKVLVEGYRLAPDARFLLAVGEVHHLITGKPKGSAQAEFRDGGWRIHYAGLEVGALPEFPDFVDFMATLSEWGRMLQKENPSSPSAANSSSAAVKAQLDQFFVPHLMAALRECDAVWNQGRRDPAPFAVAARALVLLTIQSLDSIEIADALPAKAMALVSLSKTLAGVKIEREECLLAKLMGYSTHAEELAKGLPESDAVRLYVTRDGEALKEAAQTKEARVETGYLWLLRVGELRNQDAWKAAEQAFSHDPVRVLPVFKTGLALNRFETNEALATAVLGAVLRELPAGAETQTPNALTSTLDFLKHLIRHPGAGENQGGLAAPFEASLDAASRRCQGPFLDAETYRAYYRGYFYSGLYTLGLHYLDSLSSLDAVKNLNQALGVGASGAAGDFQRWYGHLADFKGGNPSLQLLVDDLGALPNLGAPPLNRSFDELKDRAGYGSPMVFVAVRRLVSRLDTRPEHRVDLQHIAYTTLLDVRLTETLGGSALKAAGSDYPSYEAWYATFTGDQKKALQLLHSAAFDADARVQILEELKTQKETTEETYRAEYRRIVRENPENWKLREKFIRYLETQKGYAEGASLAEDWLKRHDENAGFDYTFARTALARQYYYEARYDEAWRMVEPVIESQQLGAMQRGAMVLNRLGRREEAEELAKRALDRYPDSLFLRVVLAQFYWEWARPKDAAALLKSDPYPRSVRDWQEEIAPKFAETFKDRPKKEVLAAFTALIGHDIDVWELEPVTAAVAKARNDDCAFQMVSQLHWRPGTGDLTLRMDGYKYLKALNGPRAALEWVRTAIQPSMYNLATMVAYGVGEYSLLWDLVDKPQAGSDEDFAWTMRAAASVKLGAGKDPHRAELLKYCREHPEGYWQTISRYLVGLASEEELLAQAKSVQQRCENAYYLGLRAQSQGRLEDASDWYRISVESGLRDMGEYRWAYDQLYLWAGAGKTLKRLAAGR